MYVCTVPGMGQVTATLDLQAAPWQPSHCGEWGRPHHAIQRPHGCGGTHQKGRQTETQQDGIISQTKIAHREIL